MDVFTLAAIEPGSLQNAAIGVSSWWRTIGGLIVVFGLLFLCLKLLARYGRKSGAAQARVLAVWPLGPRREIQVLRLGEGVSYVYRHDNAMVLLRQESWDEYRREHGEASTGLASGPTLPAALARWLHPLGCAAKNVSARATGCRNRLSFRSLTPRSATYAAAHGAKPAC